MLAANHANAGSVPRNLADYAFGVVCLSRDSEDLGCSGVPLPSYPSVARVSDANDPRVSSSTSGWAIASLVLGIVGGVVLSVIFGIVALGKIRDTGQKGRGMAIAGIVLSGVWVVVLVLAVVTNLGRLPFPLAMGTW